MLPVPGLGPPRQPVPAMGEEGGGGASWLGAAHHPPAARPTRLRASLELSAPDGEPPVLPAAAPRDAKCAGRAMRAASEQPPDPSSFTKCCRPHGAQHGPQRRTPCGPPAGRPMPQPGPQTPPPPAHSTPTSPPPGPRGLWDPTRAGLGGQRGARQPTVEATARGGGDLSPHPPRAPSSRHTDPRSRSRSPAAARGWRGEARAETHRPRSSVSGTLPPADVQPGGHSEATSCDLHLNELGTDRTQWGHWPRAWPRHTVLLAVTLGGRRRWGGQQDRRTQPPAVLGTDGEAQGGAPSSPARPGPPSVPKYGLPRATFHHASSSPGSSYRTPKEGGFPSSIAGLP